MLRMRHMVDVGVALYYTLQHLRVLDVTKLL